jgi:hypothetical protein
MFAFSNWIEFTFKIGLGKSTLNSLKDSLDPVKFAFAEEMETRAG